MSTAVEIDPQDTATKQEPAYPKQEPIPYPRQEPIPYPRQEPIPYPKQDPPAYEFQPVRMNMMPPAPVQDIPPSKKQSTGSTPMNYLPLSICTLVMCCFPLSLFAVRNSLKAKEAYNSGRYGEGKEFARKARNFALASIVGGIIVIAIAVAALGFEIANTVLEFNTN